MLYIYVCGEVAMAVNILSTRVPDDISQTICSMVHRLYMKDVVNEIKEYTMCPVERAISAQLSELTNAKTYYDDSYDCLIIKFSETHVFIWHKSIDDDGCHLNFMATFTIKDDAIIRFERFYYKSSKTYERFTDLVAAEIPLLPFQLVNCILRPTMLNFWNVSYVFDKTYISGKQWLDPDQLFAKVGDYVMNVL